METKGHVDRRNSTAAHIYMSGTVLGALCAHLMNRHSSRRQMMIFPILHMQEPRLTEVYQLPRVVREQSWNSNPGLVCPEPLSLHFWSLDYYRMCLASLFHLIPTTTLEVKRFAQLGIAQGQQSLDLNPGLPGFGTHGRFFSGLLVETKASFRAEFLIHCSFSLALCSSMNGEIICCVLLY